MNVFFGLPWRLYPAAALIIVASTVVVRGLYRLVRRPYRSMDALTYTLAFRDVVVGISVVLVGAGWLWQILAMFVIGLGVGGEEFMETTNIIRGLRQRPLTASGKVVSARRAHAH